MPDQATNANPPKAVTALQETADLLSSVESHFASLEARLSHVRYAGPDDSANKELLPNPTEPASEYVSQLREINRNIRKIDKRIIKLLEELEV